MGLLDSKRACKANGQTWVGGFASKGSSHCLKSPGIVYCKRQPFNLKHRNNGSRVSLQVSAKPSFYVLSTLSTEWPGWLEAKQ